MNIPYVTIDNFFETPTLVREYALSQEFYKGDRGNWPGLRTNFMHVINPELHHIVASKIIKYLPNFNSFKTLEMTFQIIGEEYGFGWAHVDNPAFNIGGVVYLTPNPPKETGTLIFDYKDYDETFAQMSFNRFDQDVNRNPNSKIEGVDDHRKKHNSFFTPNLICENRFNRCTFYDSRQYHCAQNFFGTTKENSRLTLVFFGQAVA